MGCRVRFWGAPGARNALGFLGNFCWLRCGVGRLCQLVKITNEAGNPGWAAQRWLPKGARRVRREQQEPPEPCLASSSRAAACWSLVFGVGKAKFPQEESPGASPPCSPSPSAFRVGFRAFWGRAACSQLQGCVISHLSFLAFFSLKFSSFLPAQ